MDASEKEIEELHQVLATAKLKMPEVNKAEVLESIRLAGAGENVNMRRRPVFPRWLSATLAAVPAAAMVGFVALAVQRDWFHGTMPGRNAVGNETGHPIPSPVQPYDYVPLMGFLPKLPTETLGLQKTSASVFKFVNPPWGKISRDTPETWGNDTALDIDYLSSSGNGGMFTLVETKIDSATPPDIGSSWVPHTLNGTTYYQSHAAYSSQKILARIVNGVLYMLFCNENQFDLAQLEKVLGSLTISVQEAPSMVDTQTFGLAKAPSAVPFQSVLPTFLPFKPDAQDAAAVNVLSPGAKSKGGTTRQAEPEGRLTLTYSKGSASLKVMEAVGMKYVNPNIAHTPGGTTVTLQSGEHALYFDGGQAAEMIDGQSTNRKVLNWTMKNGVNVTIIGSPDSTQADLIKVANSLQPTNKVH